MIHFQSIDEATFLNEYWQKKPLLIRQALPQFVSLLSPDELAGLATEEEVESRIVIETPGIKPYWALKRGPFQASDFEALPPSHWTLLVQAVDQLIPELALLFDHFNFIPQWRVDDLMVSYAVKQGSVGPHYDNYDVFLYQAQGVRQWQLTTIDCNASNCVKGIELRLMEHFVVEETHTLMPGDMLYLPPHVGHHGISLTDDCMTYSFGYRSYQAQELWDSFGDYLSEKEKGLLLYEDPNWVGLSGPSVISKQAYLKAKQLMEQMLQDERRLQSWFGSFVTRVDVQAEQHLPEPLESEELVDLGSFVKRLLNSRSLSRDPTCRFAYYTDPVNHTRVDQFFVNGCEWEIGEVSSELLTHVANTRELEMRVIQPFLGDKSNQRFLYELWKLQWLQLVD